MGGIVGFIVEATTARERAGSLCAFAGAVAFAKLAAPSALYAPGAVFFATIHVLRGQPALAQHRRQAHRRSELREISERVRRLESQR
jgi:hypothetical protein